MGPTLCTIIINHSFPWNAGGFLISWATVSLQRIYDQFHESNVGRDSSVGIATRYGLGGPWIETLQGARFSAPVQTGPAPPPSLLYIWHRVFPGAKTAGAWRWPPTPSSAEVEGRVQLYLYSPSGPSWPVLGWTLTFTFLESNPCVVCVLFIVKVLNPSGHFQGHP